MKLQTDLLFAAVCLASLTLVGPPGHSQVFDVDDIRRNSAIANSPRAREAYPWLQRSTATTPGRISPSARQIVPTEVLRNHALAASPRTLEEFPALSRYGGGTDVPRELRVGRSVVPSGALARSPRMLEEFPWLTRGADAQSGSGLFEIAPLR